MKRGFSGREDGRWIGDVNEKKVHGKKGKQELGFFLRRVESDSEVENQMDGPRRLFEIIGVCVFFYTIPIPFCSLP